MRAHFSLIPAAHNHVALREAERDYCLRVRRRCALDWPAVGFRFVALALGLLSFLLSLSLSLLAVALALVAFRLSLLRASLGLRARVALRLRFDLDPVHDARRLRRGLRREHERE